MRFIIDVQQEKVRNIRQHVCSSKRRRIFNIIVARHMLPNYCDDIRLALRQEQSGRESGDAAAVPIVSSGDLISPLGDANKLTRQ